MPRRSNLFPNVVAVIHEHMAGDATVEESALLRNSLTGEEREVDVVITSRVAGHELVLAAEATAAGRPADTGWVERMLGKHRNLQTDKLVLVSEGGFTKQARQLALKENAVPLAPEDLAGDDPAYQIVNHLRSIWPKVVSLTPTEAVIHVCRPDGQPLL